MTAAYTDERVDQPPRLDHTDEFLRRERRREEALRTEMGSAVVAKLDRFVLRDILYERKERELEVLLGEGAVPAGQRYRVLVTLRSGMAQTQAQHALAARRPPSRRDRRRAVASMQRAGHAALTRVESDLQQRGASVLARLWLTHSVIAELTSEQIEQIAAREDVSRVTSDKPRPALALDVSRPLIQADLVETNLGFDGTEVTVAVLDSGVDAAHVALAGVVASQVDITGEGIGDLHGHGTHCAGVIASQDRVRRGIAPGTRISDIKIANQFGNIQPGDAVQGITTAVQQGADIASNSWGFSHANGAWVDASDVCEVCTAANNAAAAGVVFVVSAGNEDNDTCATYDTHIGCPGNARAAITVGATDDSDAMASFSSIGPTADGRTKPDVVAPGVDIGSARAAGTSMGSPIDANWTNASGTSMSCPHVAGVCALMLDKNNTLTPANVVGILMATAVNIGATPNEMGAGRVDALAAVNAS